MNIALFYHSLISDWNHGNAHFLRGIASELVARGHRVRVYEPVGGWSLENLVSEHGTEPVEGFYRAYPELRDASRTYDPAAFDPAALLEDEDVVIVHEWNEPEVVASIGSYRRGRRDLKLLFHDTHHRAVTRPEEMASYDLSSFDGALVFGEVLRELYLENDWIGRVWTWHEAADTRVFKPLDRPPAGEVVWIGNWGDDERSAELHTFLLAPITDLRLRAKVHGVRYPPEARAALRTAGVAYGDWLPNFRVPEVFARFAATVHVPRRPYTQALPGIPTIRPFEAMACGIPLISAPWEDVENLFNAGRDYLVARTGSEMRDMLKAVIDDAELAASLRESGMKTIRARHTCAHRVDELMQVLDSLSVGAPAGGNGQIGVVSAKEVTNAAPRRLLAES